MPRFSAPKSPVGMEAVHLEAVPAASPVAREGLLAHPSFTGRGVNAVPAPVAAALANPTHSLATLAGIALIFFYFSNIAELLATVTGVNFRLAYVFALFAVVAVLVTGGVGLALRHRPAVMYLLFVGWLVAAIPFSSWIGGSVGMAKTHFLVAVPMIFVTAGLLLQWRYVRLTFLAIGMAGVIVVGNSLVFADTSSGDRLSLSSSGMIGNSNDLASHLVFMVPVFLMIASDSTRSWFLRLPMLGLVPLALVLILQTGSRGALVAIGFGALVVLWKAPVRVKMGFVVASALFGLLAPAVLPDNVKQRLGSLFDEDHAEAEESRRARKYLFEQSVKFSLQYPIFGVGPGQFSNFEGRAAVESGNRGSWHATHCAWTEISSECGIPALLFMAGALVTGLRMVFQTFAQSRKAGHADIANVCFYFLVASLSFMVTITFLANAYRFYLPTIIGLSIVIAETGRREMALRSTAKAEQTA